MKPITTSLLAGLYAPTGRTTCARYAPLLAAACVEAKIDASVGRLAPFLATIGVESALLKATTENLNYSAEGLIKTFPTRFSTAMAVRYARKPEAIANLVYAKRLGNGDEASGDGWRHRGGGLIQLSGKANQAAFAKACGRPVEGIQAYLASPEGAVRSAVWFWTEHGLNAVAERGGIDAVTRVVNGGSNGLAERRALDARARALIA